jgi:hypothetical protein
VTEPTDTDRERARGIVDERWDLNAFHDELVDTIAAALAWERAKARVPFLHILRSVDNGTFGPPAYELGVREMADRIRQAAEDQP